MSGTVDLVAVGAFRFFFSTEPSGKQGVAPRHTLAHLLNPPLLLLVGAAVFNVHLFLDTVPVACEFSE